MIPDKSKISIDDNEQKIKAFIDDLIITPRKALLSWSDITNQTPAAKIGYLGQHLASLVTGVGVQEAEPGATTLKTERK